jgi:glyoxylase-like metal-dependent hydrolase (beta-lactamase superfamily II)
MTMSVAATQPAAAPMVIEAKKLNDRLYVLEGGGGNTALFITADGVTVVDTKSPGGWGKVLLQKIQSITDKPVTTIINTHSHWDHLSGNPDFPASVEVIAHENVPGYVKNWKAAYGRPDQPSTIGEAGGRGMPKRTFKDKLSVGAGADEIDLFHFGPAHTGGDSFILFRALRTMHVGDVYPGNGDLPIMDKNNGGSGIEFASTIAKAASVPGVETLINGHGATTTKPADMRKYSKFIRDFVSYVQAQKKAGKSVDEVVKGWKTPLQYAGYATPNVDRVRANVEVIFEQSK